VFTAVADSFESKRLKENRKMKPLSLSALCASAVLCMMIAVLPVRANPATESFIQKNFDQGYAILNNASLSEAQRREQFRSLLLSLAATRRIALFTLGQYAMGAAPADVDSFIQAFTNYSFAVYEKGLNRYQGQALKVTSSSDRAADDSMVQAEIVNPNQANAQTFKVGFRVRRNETGQPIITDLVIDGVSLAATERDEFTAYLQSHNGSIPELIKRLNAMAEKPDAVK
jgi:phospholipid transport system substrate-binding protein